MAPLYEAQKEEDEERARLDEGARQLELESAAFAQVIQAPIAAYETHWDEQMVVQDRVRVGVPADFHSYVLDVMAARDEVVRDYLATGVTPELCDVVGYVKGSRFHCTQEEMDTLLGEAERAFS